MVRWGAPPLRRRCTCQWHRGGSHAHRRRRRCRHPCHTTDTIDTSDATGAHNPPVRPPLLIRRGVVGPCVRGTDASPRSERLFARGQGVAEASTVGLQNPLGLPPRR